MTNSPAQIEVTVNGETVQVPKDASVSQLLDQLKLNRRGIAVEINQELEPKENHDSRIVQAGDWFEIVTLVGGG